MTGTPIDLPKMRRILAKLDRLAEQHPELVSDQPTDPKAWEQILEHDDMARTNQIGVRVDDALLQALDAYAAKLSADNPGMNMTRADAIRVLLTRGLQDFQANQQQPPKRATKKRGK